MPETFSNLIDLHEKLWNQALGQQDGMKKIYTQIQNYSIVEELLLPMEQQTDQHTLLLDSNEHEVPGISWEDIKSGRVKVKAKHSGGWWQYYDPEAKGGRKKTRRKKCKRKNKSKRIDAGYYDKYRGWYDVQGCGKCYDYCRWVGNSGPGGNPKNKTIKKMKGKSKSWWSCRLANKKGRYSTRKKWKKGFNYKKCVKKGQNSALPLQGNKSMFGGRLKKRKKTRRKKKKGGCYPNCCRKATRVVPKSFVEVPVVDTGEHATYIDDNAVTNAIIEGAYNQAYDEYGRARSPFTPGQFEMIRSRRVDQHNAALARYKNTYPAATPVSESARPIIPRGLQQPDRVYIPDIIAPTVIVPSRTGGGLFKGKSTISTNFESGNINHINNVQRKKDVLVVLEIENEPYPKNTKRKYQNWFYFKSNDVQRKSMTYTIQNINVFGNDWKGFNVCYSYDNKNWKRIKTSFSKKNKTLTWKHRSTKKNVYFAYYPPYTTVMKQKMMMKYKNKKGAKAKTLGKSKVDALILGNGPLKIFIVARQHPGESIGSWMIEGFLKEYFSDVQRKVVQDIFTFYIIPMANPDGVKLGHWYTNKKGQNLNRSWRHNKTSETNAIKKLMTEKKALLYLDLHGDEGASKHFITSCIESKNKVREPFNDTMAKFCPNFQKEDYYKRHTHKVYGTMDCFDKERTLTIEGAMKHSLYKHKTIQNEGIEMGKAIYKTVIRMQEYICIDK